MLALSRKKGESVFIGDDIEIVVVDVKGDQVRLGINAPRDLVILRSELVEAIRNANLAAAKAGAFPVDILKRREGAK